VLAVTSSVAGEGKSTVSTNLAIALAETGARVLLVDGDLRRPSVARMLGLEGAAGLTTVLLGRVSAADVVQEWGLHGLDVLPSGAVPPNPTELLGSPAMRRFLQQVRESYDHVVLDTPPLLPVADGAVLSRAADGVVLVANATKVRGHQLAESLTTLEQVGARTSGVVLNQVRRDEQTYDYSRTGPVADDLPVVPAARGRQLPPPPRPAVGSGRPGR
jgi:capsular exopolysaccharide synthesis family protein